MTFLEKFNKIFDILNLTENESEIKSNLLASVYLDFIHTLASDSKNKQLIDNIAKITPATPQEFDQVVAPVKQQLNDSGINIESLLLKCSNQILKDFITDLQPNLTPEKAEQLRKIISE